MKIAIFEPLLKETEKIREDLLKDNMDKMSYGFDVTEGIKLLSVINDVQDVIFNHLTKDFGLEVSSEDDLFKYYNISGKQYKQSKGTKANVEKVPYNDEQNTEDDYESPGEVAEDEMIRDDDFIESSDIKTPEKEPNFDDIMMEEKNLESVHSNDNMNETTTDSKEDPADSPVHDIADNDIDLSNIEILTGNDDEISCSTDHLMFGRYKVMINSEEESIEYDFFIAPLGVRLDSATVPILVATKDKYGKTIIESSLDNNPGQNAVQFEVDGYNITFSAKFTPEFTLSVGFNSGDTSELSVSEQEENYPIEVLKHTRYGHPRYHYNSNEGEAYVGALPYQDGFIVFNHTNEFNTYYEYSRANQSDIILYHKDGTTERVIPEITHEGLTLNIQKGVF